MDQSKILEWKRRLDVAQSGHYRQSEVYGGLNFIFGFPLVVLSSFVSTVLFIDPAAGPTAQKVDLYARIAGIAVVVITSIQAFVRPAEKSEQHRSKAAKYGSLKRKLEFFSVREIQNPQLEEEFLRDFEISWDAVAEDSPTTPWWVRKTISRLPSADVHSNTSSGSTPQSRPS